MYKIALSQRHNASSDLRVPAGGRQVERAHEALGRGRPGVPAVAAARPRGMHLRRARISDLEQFQFRCLEI